MDLEGRTPLDLAKDAEITKLLKQAVEKMNRATPWHTKPGKKTPLHNAIERCDDEEMKKLLKEGYDPDTSDENGETPLHLAISRCGTKFATFNIVFSLLKHGAKPNAINPAGVTPPHLAAAKADETTVRVLLENYANPVLRDPQGRIPLHYAAAAGNWLALKVLMSYGGINTRDYEGNTPLHLAAMAGKVVAVMELLEHGADPLIRNNKGELPIDITDKEVAEHLKKAMTLRRWQLNFPNT